MYDVKMKAGGNLYVEFCIFFGSKRQNGRTEFWKASHLPPLSLLTFMMGSIHESVEPPGFIEIGRLNCCTNCRRVKDTMSTFWLFNKGSAL